MGESESESRELLCLGEQDEDDDVVVDLLSSSSYSSSSVCSSRDDVETQVKLELRDSGGDVWVPVSTATSGLMAVNSVCCTTRGREGQTR
jgi:hypothetical protein